MFVHPKPLRHALEFYAHSRAEGVILTACSQLPAVCQTENGIVGEIKVNGGLDDSGVPGDRHAFYGKCVGAAEDECGKRDRIAMGMAPADRPTRRGSHAGKIETGRGSQPERCEGCLRGLTLGVKRAGAAAFRIGIGAKADMGQVGEGFEGRQAAAKTCKIRRETSVDPRSST